MRIPLFPVFLSSRHPLHGRPVPAAVFFLATLAFWLPGAAASLTAPAASAVLAEINGRAYTAQEFREWWQHYREEDTPFPATPDPFVDWHLLVQEAERMELFSSPSFQRKVQVFLRARAIMLLKYEEVDSRIQLDEQQVATEVAKSLVGRPAPSAAQRRHIEEQIRRRLRKKQEQRLTAKLVNRLRQKYHVRVNEQLLARIGPETTDQALLTQPLVETDVGTYPAGVVVARLANEKRLRSRAPLDEDAINTLKKRIVQALITDTVLMREALNRHYEQRPPFQATYAFYRQHRLIKELLATFEKANGEEIDEKAIKDYYANHREEFTHPSMVRYQVVSGLKEKIRRVWLRTLNGTAFAVAVKETLGSPPTPQTSGLDALAPPLGPVIQKLAKGETSRPIPGKNGSALLVHVTDRTPAATLPLETVAARIRATLEEQRRQRLRSTLTAELRAKSRIKINQEVWRGLQQELGKPERSP